MVVAVVVGLVNFGKGIQGIFPGKNITVKIKSTKYLIDTCLREEN